MGGRCEGQPRAAVIWQRALEALAELGAVDGLLQTGEVLHGVGIAAFGRHLGHLELGSMRHSTRFPYPLMIEQHDTERVLVDHVANLGVAVEWETEAINVQRADDHCTVDLRHGTASATVRSSWVVGCEGTASVIRDAAGIAFVGGPRHGLDVVQVNAVPDWDRPRAPHHGYFFLVPDTALGVFPLPKQGYRFLAFRSDQRMNQPDPDLATSPRSWQARCASRTSR